jgi:hypothetical protein
MSGGGDISVGNKVPFTFEGKPLTEQKFDIDRRLKTAATRTIGITFVTVTGVPSAVRDFKTPLQRVTNNLSLRVLAIY